MNFPNGIEAKQDKKKKQGDLFVLNQSHDKIITESGGKAAGGRTRHVSGFEATDAFTNVTITHCSSVCGSKP